MPTMTISLPPAPGQRRRRRVSLPAISALAGDPRYAPADAPAPSAAEDRPRRAPSVRAIVRLALRCESAGQLGQALRKRFARNEARRGGGSSTATEPDDDLDARLDALERKLLGDD
jgi:hypothetical protein